MIKGKFSLLHMFLVPLLFAVALGAFPALLIWLAIREEEYTFLIGALPLLAGGIYVFRHYLRKGHTLKNNETGIRYGGLLRSGQIKWSDVKSISTFNRSPQKHLWLGQRTALALLTLKQGNEVPLYLQQYRNRAELKRAFQFIKSNRCSKHFSWPADSIPGQIKELPVPSSELRNFNRFGLRFLTSLNGIVVVGSLIVALYIAYQDGLDQGWKQLAFTIGIIAFPFFLIYGYQSHYFLVNDKYLLVKNHAWRWRKRIFRLADVKQTIIYSPFRGSDGLKVILKDYREFNYPAGSMRSKEWSKLREQLNRAGIKMKRVSGY